MAVLISFLLICLSCVIIWKASGGFEQASEYLGRNLSDGVRGATINAVGSSMPELFTTLFFLFILHNADGFAGGVGTTAGSAIFNAMIIPAVVIIVVIGVGLVTSVAVSKKVIWRDGIALLLADIVLIILLAGADSLKWWHGLILMSMYFVYMAYLFGTMKKEKLAPPGESSFPEIHVSAKPNYLKALFSLDLGVLVLQGKRIKTGSAWVLLSLATLIIGASAALLVKACEDLGHALGIEVYFVAVILASAATSLPDTILSVRDAMKGNYDDAVSNALGSNVFDICFALGFPLLLYTLITGSSMGLDAETVSNVSQLLILLLVLTFIAFVVFLSGKSLGMIQSVVLLGLYLFFTFYIIGVAYDWDWTLPVQGVLERAATGAASVME